MKLMINKSNMIKNGTISIITMLLIGILFGKENIMIAFPVALTSAVIGRQNFKVKSLNKTMLLYF
ncbi:MAG: hypothetical protein E7214_10905 [Clostridium sp.]|nr:hypothetical protein [Clostridium sp.]